MISINDITSGIALRIDNNIYLVEDYNHVKPGKGSAFVRVRVRNLQTDQVLERTFRSAERLEDIPVEEIKLQTLYQSGDMFHFMDTESYEQVEIPAKLIGDDKVRFLKENLEVIGMYFENKPLKVTLPNFIEFEVKHTEPGIKGDSSKAGTKPATIDTGATVQVPLFINVGDRIRVDTRTAQYIERLQR